MLGFAFGGVLADAFGWRKAFMLVGAPGVLFALVLYVTVKEPLRGRWDSVAANAARPSARQTLILLRKRSAFWYVALGAAFSAFVGYGNGNFFPSFLIRNHGMSIGDVGLTLALVSGVSGALGTFGGGFLADRLITRDRRWYVWVPMIGGSLAFFPYFYVLLGDNLGSILPVLFLVGIVNSFYLGPSIAVCHALVPPRMRALTSAVLFFVLNMIGLGLGPFFTGLSSDLLAPISGHDNLRHAMMLTSLFGLIAMFMYWRASRLLMADLAGHGSRDQRVGLRKRD